MPSSFTQLNFFAFLKEQQRFQNQEYDNYRSKNINENKNREEISLLTNLIGLWNLLELSLSFFFIVGVFVRMPFHSQPSVCLLQIILCCISFHIQYVIVIHTHLHPINYASIKKIYLYRDEPKSFFFPLEPKSRMKIHRVSRTHFFPKLLLLCLWFLLICSKGSLKTNYPFVFCFLVNFCEGEDHRVWR